MGTWRGGKPVLSSAPLAFSIGDRAKLAGYRVSGFDSVGSTNAEALAAAAAGDAGRHWFAAREQTAGRGRRGRVWQSQKGNLAASLLLVFPEGGDLSSLGFVAGVALAETLDTLAPGVPAKLKWPNDVLVDGKKLSGILLEAQPVPGGGIAIAIGIGVNVIATPPDLPYPATSLREAGFVLSAETIFAGLAETFAEIFTLWNNRAGLADVLALWRRHATGIGGAISVTTPAGLVSGSFEALDDSGRLLVRTTGGALEKVAAGDVHFGHAASFSAAD